MHKLQSSGVGRRGDRKLWTASDSIALVPRAMPMLCCACSGEKEFLLTNGAEGRSSDIDGQTDRSNERELLSQEFGGHGAQSAYDDNAMAIAVAAKRREFSLGSLKSGDRLLKAIKNDFRKNGEKLDYDKLRRDGHSKALIARLKGL